MGMMRYQPQGRIVVRREWLAKGLRFAFVPGAGFFNFASSKVEPLQSTGVYVRANIPTGVAFQGGGRAEFDLEVDAANGLTLVSVWKSRANYLASDNVRTLVSTRDASNRGWAWGRNSALAGASLGNRTRQGLTFQGVATYAESNYLIDSFADTAVAARFSGASRLISWFRAGLKSSPDTATGAPTLGSKLVVGALGPYATPTVDWLDQTSVLLVFDQPLSDDDAAQLTSSANAPFQVFDDLSGEDELVAAAAAPNSYTLTAAPGTFGLSGSPASLRVSRTLAGGNGSFSLAGNAVALRAGRRVAGISGVITLSGAPAALTAARKLAVGPGAYALQGSGASLMVARRLAAAAGAFTLAGGDAQLVYAKAADGVTLVTSSGQFVLTGSPVAMRIARRVQAQAGSFALAGAAAAIRYSGVMSAAPGAFVAVGAPVALRVVRRLAAAPGLFDLVGGGAALAYGTTVEYARAPAGSGYAPKRNEYQARPAQLGGARPAAIEKAYR
jgi:hypothetical protein